MHLPLLFMFFAAALGLGLKKLDFAVGFTPALLYLGGAIAMGIVGNEGSVKLFNRLLHGPDVSLTVHIYHCGKAPVGLSETFVPGWLPGSCNAGFYNSFKNRQSEVR